MRAPSDYGIDDLATVYGPAAGLTRERITEWLQMLVFPKPTHYGPHGEALWTERFVLDAIAPAIARADQAENPEAYRDLFSLAEQSESGPLFSSLGPNNATEFTRGSTRGEPT